MSPRIMYAMGLSQLMLALRHERSWKLREMISDGLYGFFFSTYAVAFILEQQTS